jgi:hypothetical protein
MTSRNVTRSPRRAKPVTEPGDDRCPECGYTDGLHRKGCVSFAALAIEAGKRQAQMAADPVEALAEGLAKALADHRASVWLDSRVHCLCGWLSAPGNGDPGAREDWRLHVAAERA